MTNREWILLEIQKADDDQLASAFCGMSDYCIDCSLMQLVRKTHVCPIFRSDTREWMYAQHDEEVTE